MKHTISILVENHAGVLSKVSGLFSRRGFNIDSLAVGVTENPKVSRITIVADGDDYTVDQLTKQLSKLVDVLQVKQLVSGDSVSRELCFIKVSADDSVRSQIIQIVDIFRAKIIDVSGSSLIIELTGSIDKLHAFEEMIRPFGIIEMVRTGVIAIERGNKAI